MKYNRQLDGLRCVAITLVLFEHFTYTIAKYFSAGVYGVDLFFVISGFLITSILLNVEQPFAGAYKTFLARRAFRIFPIYYLTTIALFLVGYNVVRENFSYFVSYTYNFAVMTGKASANIALFPLWSLCVEEQFYIVWPLLALTLKSKPKVLFVLLWVIIVMCGLQYLFNVVDLGIEGNYVGIFPRAYSLAIGSIGALAYKEKKIDLRFLDNKFGEIAMLLGLLFLLTVKTNVNMLFYPMVSLYLVLKTAHKGFHFRLLGNLLNNSKVVYVGMISYGIYLFHPLVAEFTGRYFFDRFVWNVIPFEKLGILRKLEFHPYIFKFLLYSGLTILLAHFSFRYLEKSILRLKDKWFGYKKENVRKSVLVAEAVVL